MAAQPDLVNDDKLQQYAALLNDPRKETLLKARLMQLAFDTESTVAIKAIEMLLDFGAEIDDGDLSGVSTENLLKGKQLAIDYLLKLEAETPKT